MSEDFSEFTDWTGSVDGLESLEDRDFELSVEEVEERTSTEFLGPCGSCTDCSIGSQPIGGDLENIESDQDLVEIAFKSGRTGFYINETGGTLHAGERVILGAERGTDLGIVSTVGEEVKSKRRSRGLAGQPMRKVARVANEDELKKLDDNRKIEAEAMLVFREKSLRHNLEMKLVEVEYQFDRSRITFYFTAESRVDFRSLVRDLASVYKTRIELRQIGARDEAKKIGAIGVCGMKVCCSAWMSQLKRVTLDHARSQNLSLNPTRLAGACGRLKCCILFEAQHYIDEVEGLPPVNSKVVTQKGEGYIEKIDVMRDLVYLRYPATGVLDTLTMKEMRSISTQNH